MQDMNELLAERPVVAIALVAAVATVAYVGIQLLLADSVDPLATALFVVAFTVVYAGGNWLMRRYRSD